MEVIIIGRRGTGGRIATDVKPGAIAHRHWSL